MACHVFGFMLALVASLFVLIDTTSAASPVRIMPLGDSITGSPGCWRALLWRKLQDAGITNTKFVGTLPGQDCGFAYDGANEGHGGFLASGIVAKNQLPGWLAQTHPDIVLMHLGTNDVWNNAPPELITGNFSVLVDQMRASNPKMRILVAQILPMAPTRPANCPDCPARVAAFNKEVVAWADARNKNDTASVPLTVVDCWTGFDDATDTIDGVHPNSAGNAKLAASWFGPLVAAIKASSS
ncbi:hypothetical protein SEUCBS140593_007908 [Sporothrix eucalyptigena]|uniref:SGNH hydrolase-type esterase domain-containing protein n=1 Tax=Sporothrix eucalyptigena TaxID=1812306 RepID=A0ABP0CH41_9PEZI